MKNVFNNKNIFQVENNGSKGKRSSRQDLHSHLWRHEKSSSLSRTDPSQGCHPGEKDQLPNISSFCGSSSESHHHSIPSKPLPTEPIRRVDLGPLGSFCTKPGFLGNQECLIRKVPQAIVAPFRRNPPSSEANPSSSSSQVVPIHRASISHSVPDTSLSSDTSTTFSTTTSTSLQTPANLEDTTPPSSLSTEELQRKNTEKVANETGSAEVEDEEDSFPPRSVSQNSSPSHHPKAKTVTDQKHFDQTKIRKCQVAVERLRQGWVNMRSNSVSIDSDPTFVCSLI